MKKVIAVLLSLYVVVGMTSEPAKSSKEKEQAPTKEHKRINSLVVGYNTTYGSPGAEFSFARFTSKNNLTGLSRIGWSDNLVDGSDHFLTSGSVFSINNKYFFYNSFFVKGGVFYRKMELKSKRYNEFTVSGLSKDKFLHHDTGVSVGIGNQWFGKRWSISVTWMTYLKSIKTMKNEDIEKVVRFYDLVTPELTVSYFL